MSYDPETIKKIKQSLLLLQNNLSLKQVNKKQLPVDL
jgi:hypothetical protein